MKPLSQLALPLAFAVMALAPTAIADVTYVDATTANTTPAGFSNNDDGTNTKWKFRSLFGTTLGNGGIYESYGTNDPELKTTITVPTAGTYDVYVFYQAAATPGTTTNWPIRAGLTSNPGANTLYDASGTKGTSGALASTLTFTAGANPVATNQNATYVHYYTMLGQVSVSAGGSIDVYVDDKFSSTGGDRTWYDGVGYELVPEPSSLALLSLGGLCLLRRRR